MVYEYGALPCSASSGSNCIHDSIDLTLSMRGAKRPHHALVLKHCGLGRKPHGG